MPDSIVTADMQQMIGREVDEGVAEVTTTSCRLFARAVGHTDPIFYDEAAARARGYRGIVAPPGYLGTPVVHPGPRSMITVPVPIAELRIPYKRILDGGTAYEYFEPVVAGDTITSRSKITRYEERLGSIGPMLITYHETAYTRQDGALVAKMYGNVIHY
ncbi:MAG: MaoC family dehydratase [Dehalococcoidia bacterium]|nr:MaoC family dehydratase [Dehalococcoidia bacterium]